MRSPRTELMKRRLPNRRGAAVTVRVAVGQRTENNEAVVPQQGEHDRHPEPPVGGVAGERRHRPLQQWERQARRPVHLAPEQQVSVVCGYSCAARAPAPGETFQPAARRPPAAVGSWSDRHHLADRQWPGELCHRTDGSRRRPPTRTTARAAAVRGRSADPGHWPADQRPGTADLACTGHPVGTPAASSAPPRRQETAGQ